MEWASGTELSAEDRRHVLAAFCHRMTVEAARQWPEHSRRMLAGGYRMRPFTDAQWLAFTRFAVRRNGRLDRRARHCSSSPPREFYPREAV